MAGSKVEVEPPNSPYWLSIFGLTSGSTELECEASGQAAAPRLRAIFAAALTEGEYSARLVPGSAPARLPVAAARPRDQAKEGARPRLRFHQLLRRHDSGRRVRHSGRHAVAGAAAAGARTNGARWHRLYLRPRCPGAILAARYPRCDGPPRVVRHRLPCRLLGGRTRQVLVLPGFRRWQPAFHRWAPDRE